MEDYEKRYKEALSRAATELENCGADKSLRNMIYAIFPDELKESEDEKIRKALVRFHKSTIDIDGIKGADILAWLEKQGNSSVKWQKNTPDNKPAINHSVLMKTTHGVAEGYFVGSLWYQFGWSSNIKDSDVLAWMELSDLDEQGEQKPVLDFKASNWYVSKVDGKIHDMTYNPTDKIEPKFKIGDVLCDKSCTTLNKNSQPNIEVRDIRNDMYICNNCSFPISQQDEYELVAKRIEPQLAWSDEDEGIVLSIEQVIKAASFLNLVPEKLDKIDKWLKSLKERITWKPSEEQLIELRNVISGCSFEISELVELEKQLKAL